jgi:hypothetical protein
MQALQVDQGGRCRSLLGGNRSTTNRFPVEGHSSFKPFGVPLQFCLLAGRGEGVGEEFAILVHELLRVHNGDSRRKA